MQTLRELKPDIDAGKIAILADGTSPAVTSISNMSGLPGAPKPGGRLYAGTIDYQMVVGGGFDMMLSSVAKIKPELATHQLWKTVTLEEAAEAERAASRA